MSENPQRVVPISIAMPPEMAREVRIAAACVGRSRSALVCDLVRHHLKEYAVDASAGPAQAGDSTSNLHCDVEGGG
jgi:hypothetical protein